MAIYRQVHVKMWKQDDWFLNLDPLDKLLFIYLFSNECASIAGIYELPLKVIAFETGLTPEHVTEALARFAEAGKVFYEDGVVWVVNLRKYNESASPKVQVRIKKDIAAVRDCKLKQQYIEYYESTDRVYIPESGNGSERETESENENETDSPSAGNSPPVSFTDWLMLVEHEKNRQAVLRRMFIALYPGRTAPEYSYLGKIARIVGGAGRLAEWLWLCYEAAYGRCTGIHPSSG